MHRVRISWQDRVGRIESAGRHRVSGFHRVPPAHGDVRCRALLCHTADPEFSTARTQGSRRRCEPGRALLFDAGSGESTGRSCGYGRRPPLPSAGCTPSRVLRLTSRPIIIKFQSQLPPERPQSFCVTAGLDRLPRLICCVLNTQSSGPGMHSL